MDWKRFIPLMLILFSLISFSSAAGMAEGLEIIGVGPQPLGGLTAGQEYDFNVVYECVGPLKEAGVIAVTFYYHDLLGGDTQSRSCTCDCAEECECKLTHTIRSSATPKTITFSIEGAGSRASTDAILVNAAGADPFAKAPCKELQSGANALFTRCWQYGEGPYAWDAAQFQCGDEVQVNPNHPCLVTCTYSVLEGNCKCRLSEACIDTCVDGLLFGTCNELKNFRCISSPEYSCPEGTDPAARCSNTRNCKAECAEGCGRVTTCARDCEGCCLESTCKKQEYTKEEQENCMEACRGMCEANESLCNIITLLMMFSAVISAAMIAINGFKWLISEDPSARKDARDGIVYVLLGSIVVVAAIALVAYMIGTSITCYF